MIDYDINKIKMVISDIDGVWTDGSIYVGNKESEIKKFNVNDGAGVALLRQSGMNLALISGRKSNATALRASELKIEDVYNGILNKLIPYEELKSKYKIAKEFSTKTDQTLKKKFKIYKFFNASIT